MALGTVNVGPPKQNKEFAPEKHAAQHKTGGKDAIAPSDIGAASETHAAQHKTGGKDAIAPSDIGAASETHAARHKTGGEDAIAPSDIGAAPADHTHAASEVGEGTFPTTNIYAANGTDYWNPRMRNIMLETYEPAAGMAFFDGDIALVYE